MPEAEWKSEDRAQSHIIKEADTQNACEDEESSFSTVFFCVDMLCSLVIFLSNETITTVKWYVRESNHSLQIKQATKSLVGDWNFEVSPTAVLKACRSWFLLWACR